MKILITGANRGLGLNLTNYSLRNGHTVFAGVRSIEKVSLPLLELKKQYGSFLELIELDVSFEESVIHAVSAVSAKTNALDVVFNNAGIALERETLIEEIDMEKVLLTFQVNTFGPMRIVKHFLPLIRSGENQVIINISSEAGTVINASPNDYPYCMSKTALNMFSEKIREYLKAENIRIYAVHPGWIKTDMGGDMAPGDPAETAAGLFDIIEGRKTVYSKIAFIDYKGQPMPL
jgi:NAD(P)-dependent dehydrogenase (short-subunit alcohol dehydrogenase family)